MKLSDFDFELPADRIALRPAVPRDRARMLVVQPDRQPHLSDGTVQDLVEHLRSGDILVVNNTRVIPAALSGVRRRGDAVAKISVNLLERLAPDTWSAFAKPLKRLKIGESIAFENPIGASQEKTLRCTVLEKAADAQAILKFDLSGPELDAALLQVGSMPLPPYIAAKRKPDQTDFSDYQTMFAERSGAVAAPTAGLHFTDDLVAALKAKGVETAEITLHVGAGTFLPVKTDNLDEHVMHSEFGEISSECAERLNQVRSSGGRPDVASLAGRQFRMIRGK